jgi:hypothetical protein
MADPRIQNAVFKHAQADVAADPSMVKDPPAGRRSSFSAEMFAMFREAVKDIRQTFNEVMMGNHEHAPEMGAPMNPTPQMTTESIKGFDAEMAMYAARSQSQDHSQAIER